MIVSRRKYEICVWKITHFGIKYFSLTIIIFTVMFVCLNLYYLLNMFYCTNVTKENRPRISSWAWRSTCFLLRLLLWLGLLILWLYIRLVVYLVRRQVNFNYLSKFWFNSAHFFLFYLKNISIPLKLCSNHDSDIVFLPNLGQSVGQISLFSLQISNDYHALYLCLVLNPLLTKLLRLICSNQHLRFSLL